MPLLARWLIPGQNATTVLTVAFEGAVVSPPPSHLLKLGDLYSSLDLD